MHIVTNDRYRDWADKYPEIAGPGLRIRGDYRGGARLLDDTDTRALG